jgi:hypothetical protein
MSLPMLLFDLLQSPQNFLIGCVVLLISAGLVLVLAPAFRFTIPNLILFLIGGAAGLLTCISSYNRLVADLPNPPNENLAIIGSIIVMLLGATFGGSLSVWLTVRLTKSPQSKRWTLPIAQLIVALVMVWQFLVFGLLGTLGALGMSVTGHFNADLSRVPKLYEWALLASSFSLDFAALLSLIGAALSTLRPSKLSVRFWIVGTICYWSFVAGEILMRWSLQLHLTLRYVRVGDLMPYVIGIVAALVARSFSSYVENIRPA